MPQKKSKNAKKKKKKKKKRKEKEREIAMADAGSTCYHYDQTWELTRHPVAEKSWASLSLTGLTLRQT